MVLDLVYFPAESLRKKAKPIKEITPEIKTLVKNMIETLYEKKGYGLAAPQVGQSIRLLVLDETGSKGPHNPRAFINPEIIETEGEIIAEEGCLSLPDEYANVKRYEHIVVKSIDLKGEEVRTDASGQLARIFQHEIDHLDGVLFIDRLPSFKRDTIKKHIKRRIQSGDYPGE